MIGRKLRGLVYHWETWLVVDYNPENTTIEAPALASIVTSVEPDHWIKQPLNGLHVQLAPVEPPELQPEPPYLQV